MNINSNITDQDSGKPAEFVNSTYEALKYNPQATQQVLQQGPNSGLAGLGAMAANRFQMRAQDMQQTQQAAQAGQQPQPTVLEQLQMAALQGGIMGQLPTNIQMAQQGQQAPQSGAGLADLPIDPNALPQGMAGGGLVALAEGGYLDVDGSMGYEDADSYADGGEVRGLALGGPTNVYDPTQGPWDYVKDATSRLSNSLIPGYEEYRNKMEEMYDADVDDEDAESLAEKQREYYETTSAPPSLRKQLDAKPQAEQPTNGGRNGEVPEAQKSIRNPKAEPPKEATKTDKSFKKSQMDDSHLAIRKASTNEAPQNVEPKGVTPSSLRAQYDEAAAQYGSGSPQAQAIRAQILTAERNIQEAQPQGQMVSTSGGLPAVQAQRRQNVASEEGSDMEDMITKIRAARGEPAAMSPEERAWRQEQVDTAGRDKWLQTLTAMAAGTFGGTGRNWPQAIGQGALYGLSTYRQGAQAEAEAELGLLNAESKAKEEARKAQEEAADKYFGILTEQGKLGSAEARARAKLMSDRELAQYNAEEKARENALTRENRTTNAQIMAEGRGEKDIVATHKLIEDMAKMAIEEESKTNPAITQARKDQIRNQYYMQYGLTPPGLGGGQTLAGGQGIGGSYRITSGGGLQRTGG